MFLNTTYLLTRRCTQRLFILRPDDDTNQIYLYCLAEAAARFGMRVLVAQMMSNHHHLVVNDPHGNVNPFMEHLHRMIAQCMNALRGREENLWSSDAPSVVELVEPEDVWAKLHYTAINPVKDGLVDRVDHWPGPPIVGALLFGKVLRVKRPRHFFSEDGTMPEEVELRLEIPPELGDHATIVDQLRQQIDAYEKARRVSLQAEGGTVLGRRRILRQPWNSSPTTPAPRGELRPRFAARRTWVRVLTLNRYRAFVHAYRRARAALLAGAPIAFPVGTYWLRRFANVPVEGTP